jgi:O-antigen ligase
MNTTTFWSRLKLRLGRASMVNEAAVAVWAGCTFYIMYHTGGANPSLLFPPLVLGAAAFILLTYKKPVIATVPPLLSLGVFLLNFSILGSYLFNADRYDAVFVFGNIISSLLVFLSFYTIAMKMDLDFRKTLILQCLFSTPLFPFILKGGVLTWGRLVPDNLEPNYVGMMALLCFLGALAVRSWIGTIVLSILPVYTMMVVQSRASLMSGLVAVGIIMICSLRRLPVRKLRLVLLGGLLGAPAVCIGLILMGVPVFDIIGNYVNSVFMITDEHRGIDSGGSGRTELWTAAVNLWLSHPIFGVGFKGHPLMMPDQMLAHNAYLGMLADVGLVGFGSYMLITGVAIYYIIKRGDRGLREYPLRVAIIFSYILYGVLESRAFSFGNTYSILFLLVAFDSSKIRVKQAAPAKHPEPDLIPALR